MASHLLHTNSVEYTNPPLTEHGTPYSNFSELAAARASQAEPPSGSSTHHPFWEKYQHHEHDDQHTDADARDVHLRVEHELRASSASEEEDSDERTPINKYSESHVRNYQFRSHRHSSKCHHEHRGEEEHNRSSPRTEAFDWEPPRNPPQHIMKKYIQVNCLQKGDFSDAPARWMIPVDNTRASLRAFDTAMKLAGPDDHFIIIHVREHEIVDIPLREAYREWHQGVTVLKRFYDLLKAAGRHEGSYTILLPVFYDARKICLKFAKKLHVDTIVIGKHQDQDKSTRVKNVHWRTFSSYITKHSRHMHVMVV